MQNKQCGLLRTLLFTTFISSASIVGVLVTPALPQIQNVFHLSVFQTQMITTVFLIAYVIGQIVYGPIAKRFGRVNAITAGMALNFVGQTLCVVAGFYHAYDFLLVGRFVSSLGAAAGLVCTYMIIHELHDQRAAKKITAKALAGFTLGSGLAVILGGVLTAHFGWLSSFIALSIYAGVLLLLSRLLPESMQAKELDALDPKAIMRSYAQGFSSKKLWMYSFIVGCSTLFVYAFSASAPLICNKLFHLNSVDFSYFNIINAVMMFAGCMAAGMINFKLSPQQLLKRLLLLMFIGFAALYLLTNLFHNVWIFFLLSGA